MRWLLQDTIQQDASWRCFHGTRRRLRCRRAVKWLMMLARGTFRTDRRVLQSYVLAQPSAHYHGMPSGRLCLKAECKTSVIIYNL